ncbi:MAG: hypothetical protein JNJ54_16195, partial [Myxococcaceae bacterium]|nr:hypothetical protein [Myxococcaceae bacterium]
MRPAVGARQVGLVVGVRAAVSVGVTQVARSLVAQRVDRPQAAQRVARSLVVSQVDRPQAGRAVAPSLVAQRVDRP